MRGTPDACSFSAGLRGNSMARWSPHIAAFHRIRLMEYPMIVIPMRNKAISTPRNILGPVMQILRKLSSWASCRGGWTWKIIM